MSKLPIVTFRIRNEILLRLGFERIRQRGSQVFYRHADGRTTTVPYNKGKDLPRPLNRKILTDINLTPEQFKDMVEDL
jgi:predicted RNA binding protein YcfA (HicA-like mRNA interferase family)